MVLKIQTQKKEFTHYEFRDKVIKDLYHYTHNELLNYIVKLIVIIWIVKLLWDNNNKFLQMMYIFTMKMDIKLF